MQPLNTTAPVSSIQCQPSHDRAIELLSSGGDARILVDPASCLNQYLSTPYPREVIAYASSTANDIGADAFARVVALVEAGLDDYTCALEAMRVRLRRIFALDRDCDVVFAASGTDLEYVPLAGVADAAMGGVHNILLGADEVGSGCIHSARGRHFADRTPLGITSESGAPVDGLARVSLVDIAGVRLRAQCEHRAKSKRISRARSNRRRNGGSTHWCIWSTARRRA
ncbi:hypothetical protein [Parerythrobacter lacustris]|uniref:Uncharacterized protein n=1 Tax=Parerythrobacter lacustris TaxID=2969984 RepID=A0ABT1XPW1_9SPHN|nr:hypothetical protein [Parerythrobacter lacustris]MCR2833703.1 hypothetical protein [Parerythrobacter lacustris]